MSRTIQEALDLPVIDDLLRSESEDQLMAIDPSELQEITDDESEQHDVNISTDQIYKETMQHAKDLMDLGYNVDTKSSAAIFDKAAAFYKIALESKAIKRDLQLKNKKLAIDERKITLEERIHTGEGGDSESSDGGFFLEDRNAIIQQIRDNNNK